ncbi:Outer membrane porin F [Zhongshania aliphaticivorans]|uniref:Outer membrane porin F n=1 Tax=Zhongshania aliphaticivorans TaxID=1470434 RepID=A0A5S9P1C7_9GAMM|nr:OmpA family protein [Zhongshania aliphaticivorans]CAA0089901.1 Outer membrane porin F [Zhongshania aliphaticivorans]CAA0097028.1 Outer membrane porin F [Zhongshania aliphaticivorans]
MKFSRRLMSVSFFVSFLMTSSIASADALTDLLNTLGLPQLLSEVGSTVGTVGASVLDPVGTGDNDFLGVDVLNPEDDLGATVGGSGELTGFGNKTDSETAIPLDALGLSELLNTLGLTYEAGFATQLRGLLGPEGVITEGLVDALQTIPAALELPGLAMGDGLVIDGAENGLIGLSVLDSGSGGNGGAIGVAILSGENSGNGDSLGVAVLSGSNSGNSDAIAAGILSGENVGNGGNIGIGVLSGDTAGNGESVGVGVLNGANSGNGDTAGVAVLSGDNSGNAVLAGVAALNGANSGNSDTIAVGAINGENSGNAGVIAVGALNGPESGQGGLVTVVAANEPTTDSDDDGGDTDSSCTGAGSVACGEQLQLAMLDSCKDVDGDGVCDERDECLNTPADMPVFLTGCHLTEDAPLVLRGVNFEFDKADLTPESYPILEHAVRVLAAQPAALVAVDGHTDSKGSDAYNMRLSYQRASTVYSYLIDSGIASHRLAYRGFGESVPIASNVMDDGSDDPVGRAENRRVELTILDGETFSGVKQENVSE